MVLEKLSATIRWPFNGGWSERNRLTTKERITAWYDFTKQGILGCVASASLVAMYLGVPSSMHSAFEVRDMASWISAIPLIIVAFVANL